MQLRYATDLTADEYIQKEAWKDAQLENCPLHLEGGCGLARHGTYGRKFPCGMKIPRWYCKKGHQTFSKLPDWLAARYSGTLDEVETVIEVVENSGSQEIAIEKLRIDIEFSGALRWVRRRIAALKATFAILIRMFPIVFANCKANLASFRSILGTEHVLTKLREVADQKLSVLPPPVGFYNSSQRITNTSREVLSPSKSGRFPPELICDRAKRSK